MRRIVFATIVTFAIVATPVASAWASWSKPGTDTGRAIAASVNRPNAPTVTKSGTNAVVNWSASTMDDGTAATGYSVLRHAGATTTTICTTTAPTVTCTDASPYSGVATYGVVAKYKNWTGPESNTTSFAIDGTAPVTTAAASGTANAAGWIKAASSTVTFTSTDAGGSGVASLTYKVGSASAVTVNAATANVTVNAQGSTTITYYATDVAGNVESTKTITVKLDNVAPTAAGTFPVNGATYDNNGSWGTRCRDDANHPAAGICGTVADVSSGVVSVQYELRRDHWLWGDQCWYGSGWDTCTGAYTDTASGPTATDWYIPLTWDQRGNPIFTTPYYVKVKVTDAAGNVFTSTSPLITFY